jgi:3,4-dihydroxy 2-butanone 4-phosphate synthase/GTP cyclohydrolase II
MVLAHVRRAVEALRNGRMVVVVDDADRENEGDLCIAAEHASAQAINFMATHGRGLICLALPEARLRLLDLPPMVAANTSPLRTAFTVSIEAREGVTTGISAADRARTIAVAIAADTAPGDLVRPGHVFPLQARPGGVLVRSGHTEAAVDLADLAGLQPAGVICEIMNDDGSMARGSDLLRFCSKHDLAMVSIAELIEYRMAHESLVQRLVVRDIVHPQWGSLTLMAYGSRLDARQHLVLTRGDLRGPPPLVRVQAGLPMNHLLQDLLAEECDSLVPALANLCRVGRGALVFLDTDAAPLTLEQRIARVGSSMQPPRSVQREIGIGAQILRDLGLQEIRLLTNHPRRLTALQGFGLSVVEVVPLAHAAEVVPLRESA